MLKCALNAITLWNFTKNRLEFDLWFSSSVTNYKIRDVCLAYDNVFNFFLRSLDSAICICWNFNALYNLRKYTSFKLLWKKIALERAMFHRDQLNVLVI